MINLARQIVKGFEEQKLTIDQLSEEFDFSDTEIKAVLAQYSVLYRRQVNKDKQLDFTEDDLELSNNAIKQLMLSTEDEGLRFRCAKYIRDDKKGRKDVLVNGLRDLGANILEFNEHIRRARLSIENTRQLKQVNNTSAQPAPQTDRELEPVS